MNYRRVLLVLEQAHDASRAMAAIRGVAPHMEVLVVVVPFSSWPLAEAPDDGENAGFATLVDQTAAAQDVDVRLVPDLNPAGIGEIAAASGIDLLVAGSSLRLVAALTELRKRLPIEVLWIPRTQVQAEGRPFTRLVCVAPNRRAAASVAAFLRDRCDSSHEVTVLSSTALPDPAAALDVAGIRARVRVAALTDGLPPEWFDENLRDNAADLVVLARMPAGLLAGAFLSVPCLLLPPPPAKERTTPEWSIDAPDIVADGNALRVRLDHAPGLGRGAPISDQEVAFVADGRVVARATTRNGEADLPGQCAADVLGVFRADGRGEADPIAAIEQMVSVVRPGSAPLVLFDAELASREMDLVRGIASRCDLLAVRMRATRSCRSLRERLRAAGLAPRIADASLILDEGEALDVPDAVHAVRLARVAARMRGMGFPVAAIVHRPAAKPDTVGFAALRPHEIAAHRFVAPAPVKAPASLEARLEATAAPSIAGNRIEVELDNVKARDWLLSAMAASRERIHIQVYMAADDDIGRRIESAIAQATTRGVQVRLLVDSLHGRHGSFGARNPLLERLGGMRGVELRLSRPVNGLPSVEDLKRRDHRKLVVVDGALALLGGRNFSHEYYSGFSEVALTPLSMWREVPWLDAGARVEGPAVAELERGFLEAWTDAGGKPFEVAEALPAGNVAARVVVHRGLRDARTLEAYLALIDTAKSHLHVVNGFPLILELQHALLRAARRGVRVRVLFGHLTPTHAQGPFGGPWAAARTAATAFVHSRVDALVAAGCEARQFSVPQQTSWAEGLGPVRSHVHAKLMTADGRVCAVGSANMDFTGGYWESELLLVVEDEGVTADVDARIEELIADAVRVDKDDPQWRQLARSREWLRHWPSLLS